MHNNNTECVAAAERPGAAAAGAGRLFAMDEESHPDFLVRSRGAANLLYGIQTPFVL